MNGQLALSAPSFISGTEEAANRITHGLGILLSAFGAVIMYAAVGSGDGWRIAGCAVYLASLIGVYTMSTLSHSFENPRLRAFFRALDQGTIYLLIAGTYTPFAMAYLRTDLWWVVLAAVWIVALGGFASKVWLTHRLEAVSHWPCLVLGAMPLISIPTLVSMLSVTALWWMLIGIGCYMIGLWFWLNDRRGRHFHAVWHVLVIAGSTFHFMGILLFVALVR